MPTIEVIPRSSDQHALSPNASQKSATFPLMSPSPRGAFLRAPKYSGGVDPAALSTGKQARAKILRRV